MFFMKELKGVILSQNHMRIQGGGSGCLGPLNRNATNNKRVTKKPCFSFSVFLVSLRATVHAYNST